jgi:hypothetical protein
MTYDVRAALRRRSARRDKFSIAGLVAASAAIAVIVACGFLF